MINPTLLTVYTIDYSRLSDAQINWSIEYLERSIINLRGLGCSPDISKKGILKFQKIIQQLKVIRRK